MIRILSVLASVALALGMTMGVADARGPHGDPHGNGGISGTQPTGDASSRSGRTVTCTDSGVVVLGTSTCQTTLSNGHDLTCTIASGDTCSDTLSGLGGVEGVGGGLDRRGPRGPGGVWPYPGLPGGFPQLLNGNLLSLEALGLVGVNANIDVCSYPSFEQFDAYAGPRFGGGWGMARNRWFGGNQGNSEWLALRQAAQCGVVPNGLNSFNGLSGFNGLLNGNFLNLSQYGVSGLSQVNVCQYPSWDSFSGALQPRFGGRWGGLQGRFGRDRGAWTNSFNQLRMQAACGSIGTAGYQPVTPIYPSVNSAPVVNPAPAPAVDPAPVASAPTTTEEAAPSTPTEESAPATNPSPPSGSTIVEVPSGPIQTGDSGLAPDAVSVN